MLSLKDIPDPDLSEVVVEKDGIILKGMSLNSSRYNAVIVDANRRRILKQLDLDDPIQADDLDRTAAAHLVTEWNLEDELTVDNVKELFRKRLDIFAEYMKKAGEAANFTKPQASGSKSTQESGSGSQGRQQKAQK